MEKIIAKKTRFLFVAQRPMTHVDNALPYFNARQNKLFYGFYLLDTYDYLKKMRPLYFFPAYEDSFWQQISIRLSNLFLWRGVYSRLRISSLQNAREQILFLAKQEQKYDRFIFLLENLQMCQVYLSQVVQEKNIVLFCDQNNNLAGIYLAKGVALEDSVSETNPYALYKTLEDYYEISLQENLIIHYNEQDIGLSLLQLQKEANPKDVFCYESKVVFVQRLLRQKDETSNDKSQKK